MTNTILASATLGTSQAIAQVAPVLQDLPFNFAISNLSNLPNGQQTLTQLSNILSNHQNTLFNTSSAINAISDFKKKIIRKTSFSCR